MFSTKERLKKRTGKNLVDRPAYLRLLVDEYKTSKSLEAKQQVLANLANFAYDPINYGWLRKLNVIRLFLEELSSSDDKTVEFSIGGLCNLCLDFENKEIILQTHGSLSAIKGCLTSNNPEIITSSITLLIYLITPKSKAAIKSEDILELMVAFSRNPSKRFSNLAHVFLADYCDPSEVSAAQLRVDEFTRQNEISSIPLP